MLSKNSKQSFGAMLDVLICAEHKLRDVLDSDLNPIDAFGEVVNATETFALQTVHMPRLHSINSTDHKVLLHFKTLYIKISFNPRISYIHNIYLNIWKNYNLCIYNYRYINIQIPEYMLYVYG